jgi:methionine-rich copper-binding protein CopC
MASLRLKIALLGLLGLLLTLVLGWEQLARAHAEVERSEPAANAVIPAVPAEVHLWFTQELFRRKGANIIEVSGSDGNQVDQGDTRIDDNDRKHLIVSLKSELPPGVYTVRWRNLSIEDGHEGSGEFSFTVDPTSGKVAPQTNPTAAQSAAETPTSLPAPTPGPPASGGLPCLSGLLLGGVWLVTATTCRRR